MRRIAAAENLLIDMDSAHWRLLTNPNSDPNGERIIVEANAGEPLRYIPVFATTRRLPKSGTLSVDYIREVVLGWSNTDEAWHLGLLLGHDLAEARGSRWCEIAYWPDPDTTVFIDLAREAGETLAQTLSRPFELIPPRPRTVVDAPPVPLPDLPINCGLWMLERPESSETLQFVRSRSWTVSRLLRAAWYTLWVVVYIILSVSTLSTDLALPNAGTMLPSPQILPYLGLVAAIVLIGMILYIFYELLTLPDRIVVDPQRRVIAALKGTQTRWQVSGDELQSVYVTQVVNKSGKKRAIYQAELNLHLGGGSFQRVIDQSQQEEMPMPVGEKTAVDGIYLLQRGQMLSDFQAAGLYVAETMGNLTCWYDQRVR